MKQNKYYERRYERNSLLLKSFQIDQDLNRVCSEFGIGPVAARTALSRMGVKFSRFGFRNHSACSKNKELVIRMANEGASFSEIAREIGTNKRHVKRFLRGHGVDREFPVGVRKEKHYRWSGGRLIDKGGYVLIHMPEHPDSNHQGYIREHRFVMSQAIGRRLLPQEVVHHRDKNPQNNSIENLQLFSENSEHLAHELKGQCPKWTREGLERMKKGIARSARNRRGKTRQQIKSGGLESK